MSMIWNGSPLGFDKHGRAIAYDGNAPTLIFGPQGSNKTVGYVCNALLDDDTGKRSYLVLDPKGEVYAITSKFRRSLRGHKVRVIAPFQPEISDGWNPLGRLVPDTPGYADSCASMAIALIPKNSNESQPIFPNSARSAFTGGINWEVRDARGTGQTPSIANVRAVLTRETAALQEFIEKMVALDDAEIAPRMRKFLDDNREIQSIKSNIETDTAWMTQEMIDDMATAEGVDFEEFATHPATVYVIIPTKELKAKAAYLRLVLSAALRALYRDDGVPATVIIEEAFVLGYHEEIEQAASILRGYGSRFSIVFQSLQQARELYPKTWGLFTGGAVLGFRPSDVETAEWMVKRSGKAIVPVYSASDPKPGEAVGQGGWQQKERDRIGLGDMFRMPQGRALVWLPHEDAPRTSWVKGYFEMRKLARRASPNPYYKGSRRRRAGRAMGIAVLAVAALFGGLALLPRPVLETLRFDLIMAIGNPDQVQAALRDRAGGAGASQHAIALAPPARR